MTEKELIKMGFEKVSLSEEESGAEAFHYYFYKVGLMEFITNANTEITHPNKWYVELLEGGIEFRRLNELKIVIELLEQNKKV
jgi:hypothetical protein